MVIIDRVYAGAAAATVVNGVMTPSVPGAGQTFTVQSDAGYPVTGKFITVISRGVASEEKILITSRAGTVFTVGQRGYDGTTAQNHADQSTCELAFDAAALNLMVAHVDDTEATPHATKLPVGTITGHDNPTRHQFGSGLAFGLPGTPAVELPNTVGTAGTGDNPAREDHAHGIGAAAASTITGANAEGSSFNFARADHNHAVGGTNYIPAAALVNDSLTNAQVVNTNALLFVGASDPGAVGNGNVWMDTSAARQIKVRNAANTGWELYGELIQPFEDFTPSFPMVVLGTGGHKYGRIWRMGNLIVGIAGFTLGSGTGNVTGTIKLDVPHTLHQPLGSERFSWMSGGRAVDASAGATYAGIAMVDHNTDSTSFSGYATAGASASWDNNTPFDWTDSDHFHGFFMGEKV